MDEAANKTGAASPTVAQADHNADATAPVTAPAARARSLSGSRANRCASRRPSKKVADLSPLDVATSDSPTHSKVHSTGTLVGEVSIGGADRHCVNCQFAASWGQYDTAPKHRIFDGDSFFNAEVVAFIKTMGTRPCRTSFRSPWQDPVAERWIGSCRRELLDHVVVFHERHLVRLVRGYVAYYHQDRTHLGLDKDTPARIGGLHHRYEWRDAA